MNKVIMMARLTRDPEVRYTTGANQMAIATIGIAVDRRFKRDGEPDADFFNCTAFGKQAEFAEKYLKKGTKVVLCGRLQNNDYTNRDGQKVRDVRIVLDEIEFAESKNAQQPASKPKQQSRDGFMSIPDGVDDDELPFNFN